MSVDSGNWRIFEHMVVESGASISRNMTVASIEKVQKKTRPSSPVYAITTKDAGSQDGTSKQYDVEFDNVIIANPWQFGNIKTGEGVLDRKIDEIPYTKLHVTLFASPSELSPEFFGLKAGSKAPATVYTTLGEDEEPRKGGEGVGRTGFYSISTLKYLVNPKTGQKERVYKIFSPTPVTADFLTRLLGTDIPDSVISGKLRDDANASNIISWYHPHWFNSYPVELPRVTFEDPIIGDGIYYTSGIESFVSCMETSALMGKNVARLAVDNFAGISRPEPPNEWEGYGAGEEEEEGIRAQAESEL
jgi:prenylcysteine oxidase/farnesylcysteine lyase